MSLIIVAGPAGAGKTTFADLLKRDTGNAIVRSDDVLSEGREHRPGLVRRAVLAGLAGTGGVILEGCEALRALCKTDLVSHAYIQVFWIECHQPKAECGGLTTQQERYLNQLRKERPDVPIYRVTNY